MVQEQIQVDISDSPDLRRIAEAVRQSGRPCLLTESGEAVAVVTPLTPEGDHPVSPQPRRRAKGRFSREDPLFALIGIGEGKTPGGVSGKKHEALARAYRPK
jgi:antitoxin (DNA-binding transcriptional repressor) of toxin-antitoxin stability system